MFVFFEKEFVMKKGLLMCLAVIAVFAVATGCGSAPASAPAQNPNMPPWFNEVPPEDVLWGVGIAKQSSLQMSMTTAEARARTSIARQLNAKVDAMFTDYNRDAGTVGSQTALALQENVSRQITSMQLNGARPNVSWQAPDGTWWSRVEYKISDARAALAPMFTSEEAQYAEFKADEALRLLDSHLARQERPAPVSE
jgi:hypothetical protein